MLKKFEFYFHTVEFYYGVWLCCVTDMGHRDLIIPLHMQFSVPREQKTGLFSAHAVMILILLYTFIRKAAVPQLGEEAGKIQNKEGQHAQKRNKRQERVDQQAHGDPEHFCARG